MTFLDTTLLQSIINNDSDDDNSVETKKEREMFVLEREFTRKTVKFQFMRGGSKTITFDDASKRPKQYYNDGFKNGRIIAHRGNTRVEQFVKIVGGRPHTVNNDKMLLLEAERTGEEVTTQNVNSREIIEEKLMRAYLPVYDLITVRADTGEEISRGILPVRQNEDQEAIIEEVQ